MNFYIGRMKRNFITWFREHKNDFINKEDQHLGNILQKRDTELNTRWHNVDNTLQDQTNENPYLRRNRDCEEVSKREHTQWRQHNWKQSNLPKTINSYATSMLQ